MRSVRVDALGERAVSDTLGFVLVFGLVVSTVAVVYVGGFDALTGARDAQRFDNAERAFDILDSNVEDLLIRGAPSRATELQLSDASIGFGPPVSFNVTTASGDWYQRTVRPVVYSTDSGDELVYANGALFRQYDDAAVMFDEPRVVTGDRTMIPFVVTRGSGSVSPVGTQRLLVRTSVSSRNVETIMDASGNLTIQSPRADAWGRYLEAKSGGDTCTVSGEGESREVTCRLPAGNVYVQEVVVDVQLG